MSRGERGSVTAEFAIALPAVLLVLALLLGGMHLGGLQVRAQDAAADAARALARGDPGGVVAGRLGTQLPGASLASWTSGDLVCVRVSVTPNGPVAALGLVAAAESCALGGGR